MPAQIVITLGDNGELGIQAPPMPLVQLLGLLEAAKTIVAKPLLVPVEAPPRVVGVNGGALKRLHGGNGNPPRI